MNENAIIKTVPSAAELRKVPNFDPLKYLKRTVSPVTGEQIWKLDLDFKKLWFKLACPDGRMVYNNLRITEQMAMIEARVYTNRNDLEPLSNFTATVYASTRPGCYVQFAQEEALNEALDNAGFGIQLCDLTAAGDSMHGSEIPVAQVEAALGKTVKQPLTKTVADRSSAKTQARAESVEQSPNVSPVPEAESIPAEANAPISEERHGKPAMGKEQPAMTSRQEQPQEAPQALVIDQAQKVVPEEKSTETVVMDFPAQVAQQVAPSDEVVESSPDEEDGAQNAEALDEAVSVSYTEDMSVEEICDCMTLEQALSCVVDFGTCKGWTVGQVAEQRVSSLKFYLNGHSNAGNILKAAATLALMDKGMLQKAG